MRGEMKEQKKMKGGFFSFDKKRKGPERARGWVVGGENGRMGEVLWCCFGGFLPEPASFGNSGK